MDYLEVVVGPEPAIGDVCELCSRPRGALVATRWLQRL